MFRHKKCLCGFDTTQAEIKPNPVGRYFCPVCGRDLIPIKPKKEAPTEPEGEPEPSEPES